MLCVDCAWCVPNFRLIGGLDFHDGFVCTYGDSLGIPFPVNLGDTCHHNFSETPSKPIIMT